MEQVNFCAFSFLDRTEFRFFCFYDLIFPIKAALHIFDYFVRGRLFPICEFLVTMSLSICELYLPIIEVFYPTNNTFTFGNTTAGFALGAGAEVRLADHWLLRGEYLYMEFDDLGGNGLISCNAPGVGNCNAGGNTTRFNFTTSKFKDNVGRVAVSYKF